MATKSKAKNSKTTAKKKPLKDLRPGKADKVKGGRTYGPESLDGNRSSIF